MVNYRARALRWAVRGPIGVCPAACAMPFEITRLVVFLPRWIILCRNDLLTPVEIATNRTPARAVAAQSRTGIPGMPSPSHLFHV